MSTVRSPLAPIPPFKGIPVNPIPPLAGKTIALLDNSKHNAGEFLNRMKAAIDEVVPDVNWLYERKGGAFRPMSDEAESRILSEADLVLTGCGDCGCASWSSSDTVRLEKAGMPVIAFFSTPFMPLARQLTRSEGIDDARLIEVIHPLGGLQAAGVDGRAANVHDIVVKLVAG